MMILRYAFAVLALTLPLSAAKVHIYQTNAAGDAVDIIDPTTNKVVMRVKDIEAPHGVTFAPDGSRAYITVESDSTVWATDTKTGKRLWSVPLSGHPNNIAVSKDGKRLFVAIVKAPGAVDVIDTVAAKNIKTIPIKGAAHNTYVTPEGKAVVVGSVAGKMITVIDPVTLEILWELPMDQGVRPIAFDTAGRMFAQLSNVHGFAVIDMKTHKETSRVMLPDEPKRGEIHSGAPSHGIGVSPDGKTLWVDSSQANAVFAYSLPDMKLLGHALVGHTPDWLTFTPDSKMMYVANAGSNYVSAIDMATFKEVAQIPVGEVPKRNGTLVMK